MMNNELKIIIRKAAVAAGVDGVMALTAKCDISYERVSRVWQGSLNAKLCDVAHVADKLGLKIKFVKIGDNNETL